jgi:ferredoxin
MNFYQLSTADNVEPVNESKPMAEPTNKYPENVPGPYYVDDTCIDCDRCRSTAPDFFTRQDDGGYTYVHRQPKTPEEIAQTEAARLDCPTDSIGNDGGMQPNANG